MEKNINLIEIFGPGGLFATGAVLGSILTAIVQHFFESKRLRKEREFQLKKETYFKLEGKAENIFEGLYILKRRADEMKITLDAFLGGIIKDLFGFEDDFKKERIKLASNLQLFFPDNFQDKYNSCVSKLSEMGKLHFKLCKERKLVKEEIDKFDKLYREFNVYMLDTTNKIINFLKIEKEKVYK
jgi:hypothetical protein